MKKIVSGIKKGRKLARRYPWDDWLSRESFSIQKGIDYDCMPHGMGQMIRNRCQEKGLRPHVSISPDGKIDVTIEKAVLRA